MKKTILDRLQELRKAHTPVALVTDLLSGSQCLVVQETSQGDLKLSSRTLDQVKEAINRDRSVPIEEPRQKLFVRVFNPPLQLAIVGAVHIAQFLAPIATLAGYRVSVIDPRPAFASNERFPEVHLSHDWPDTALEALAPNFRTAIVAMTHDPKIDDLALQTALKSNAFYIGALGSRRTHATRVARLIEAGFDEETIARIHGPVGLDIKARTPAEIALSIIAEITQVRNLL